MQIQNLDNLRSYELSGYVALNPAGDVNTSAVVSTKSGGNFRSRLDKWFNTEARQKMSFDVLAALHRTLTQGGHNEGVVNMAFDVVFGADKMNRFREIMGGEQFRSFGLDRVKAEDIRKVLCKIDHANAQGAANVAAVKFSFVYGKDSVKGFEGVNFSGMSEEQVGLFKRGANEIGKALYGAERLLASDPALGGNVKDAKARINTALRRLEQASNESRTFYGVNNFSPAAQAAKNQLLADVEKYKAALEGMLKDYENPDALPDTVSKDAITEYLGLWKNVGTTLIDKATRPGNGAQAQFGSCNDELRSAVTGEDPRANLKNELHRWIDQRLREKSDGTVDLEATLKGFRDDFKKQAEKILAKGGYVLPRTVSVSDLIQEELNAQDWKTIKKEFKLEFNDGKCKDGTYTFKSMITPSSQVETERGDKMPRLIGGSGRTQNGINCYCAKSAHEVNGAKDELRVAGPDGKEVVAFESWHHGVHSSYKEENRALRTANNNSRAVESVKGMFLSRPDLVRKALEAHKQNPRGPVEVPFNVTSISLLSFSGGEWDMTVDQYNAWSHVNDHVSNQIVVNIQDEDKNVFPVQLKPTVNMFTLSGNPLSKFSWDLGGFGWWKAEDSNNQAYRMFVGQVDSFLAVNATSADPDVQHRCKYLKILQTQLKAIWESKSYQRVAGGAYSASSRIAVMTYLMGGMPDWNCKSGKDRTGMMSAECKKLAALVAMERDIPLPGDEPTADENRLFRSMVLKGGQIEMQRYNTGLGGYKAIGRVKALKQHLGGWLRRAKGVSKYTGAAK